MSSKRAPRRRLKVKKPGASLTTALSIADKALSKRRSPQKLKKKGRQSSRRLRTAPGIGITPGRPAPVSKPYTLEMGRPRLGDSVGAYPVVHGEYLQDLAVTFNQSVMNTITYNINPALQDSFPWLGAIGGNWEYYEIDNMTFEYSPIISTLTNGDVSMVINYDSQAAPFTSVEQFLTYAGGKSGNLYTRMEMQFSPRDEAKRRYYCRTGPQPSDTDIREYDVGNFQVRIDNAPINVTNTITYGRLLVKYAVRFFVPSTSQTAGGMMTYNVPTGITGLTRTANYGNVGIDYTSPTVAFGGAYTNSDPVNPITDNQNFPRETSFILDPGTWYVNYNTQGASGVSPWTPAGVSGTALNFDTTSAAVLQFERTIDNIVGGSATWNYIIRTIARAGFDWVFSAGSNGYAGLVFDIIPAMQSWLTSFPGSAILDSQDIPEKSIRRMGLQRVYRRNWVPKQLTDALERVARLEKQLSMIDSDAKLESKETFVHVSREKITQSPVVDTGKPAVRSKSITLIPERY